MSLIPVFPGNISADIELVGVVTENFDNASSWDSSAEAIDVLSVASVGDLVVIAFSFFSDEESAWSWSGMAFTDASDLTGQKEPGAYIGYRVVQPSDANPYVTGASGQWYATSVVCAVFKNARSFVDIATENKTSGAASAPNPPALTAEGGLWIATLHAPVRRASSAPAGYTLADEERTNTGGNNSTTAIAYKVETLSSDDPDAFGNPLNTQETWVAHTLAFAR